MATKIHIQIPLGDDFTMTIFHVRDQYGNIVNMSNNVGACNLRKNYTSANAIVIPVQFNSNGDVILSGSPDFFSNVVPGRYVYDVIAKEQTSGDITRVVEGYAYVTPQVSAFPANTHPI
jgi:hypothetical protein